MTKPSRVESRSLRHSHADVHGTDTGPWAQVNADLLPPDQRVSAQLERMMKRFFEMAVGVVEEGSPAMAEKLRRATPHWMRHTHATHLLESGAELTTVRDNLHHASLATTSMYLHVDDASRQADRQPLQRWLELPNAFCEELPACSGSIASTSLEK